MASHISDSVTSSSRPYEFLQLPQELQGMILGHLVHPKDLQSCSLVCKSFLHMCRYRLYATLDLFSGTVRSQSVKSFLTLLESTYSTLGPYIHHLRLNPDPPQAPKSRVTAAFHQLMSWSHNGQTIATSLENLHSLTLIYLNWQSPMNAKFAAALSGFKHLRMLSLRSIRFDSGIQFISLLQSFPGLQEFTLSKSSLSDSHPVQLQTLPGYTTYRSTLRCLTLHEVPVPFIDVLQLYFRYPVLRFLDVSVVNARLNEMTSLGRLIRILEFLHQIDLRLTESNGIVLFKLFPPVQLGRKATSAEIGQLIDLSHNAQLATVNFKAFPPEAVTHVLASISSYIEYIEISIGQVHSFQSFHTYPLDWQHLERVFSGPEYSSLRVVCFSYPGGVRSQGSGWDDGDITLEVHRKLPVFAARGLIRVAEKITESA